MQPGGSDKGTAEGQKGGVNCGPTRGQTRPWQRSRDREACEQGAAEELAGQEPGPFPGMSISPTEDKDETLACPGTFLIVLELPCSLPPHSKRASLGPESRGGLGQDDSGGLKRGACLRG